MVNKINDKLLERISQIHKQDREVIPDLLKEIYELRDIEEFKKLRDFRFEKIKVNYKNTYKDPKKYQAAVNKWIAQNDLIGQPSAWANPRNNKYLKIKDSVEKEHYSEQYKYLLANKPLLNYYNLYNKYNSEFRKLLNIDDLRKLPPNFIPNVRKEFTIN